MKKCPHAKDKYGCNALINNGFAKNTLVIQDNWWVKFCCGPKYKECPNLKAALSMKQEKENRTSTGGNFDNAQRGNSKTINNKSKIASKTAIHAHGGKAPHFCERPWRSPDLRFRVCKSEYYNRPWLS